MRLSVQLGIFAGLAIIALEMGFMWYGSPLTADTGDIAWWKGLLASFYGGIGEEVLLRLFVMTSFST